MLQPTNRLTLIDAMRPPAGFCFESAMAVTFTLDLRALLAAPAAFALTGPDGIVSDGSQHEPIELLHALRSHAGKITVFSQVGDIAMPPSRRVFAFLERAVVPVDAPNHGIVHPKVWVLRYEARDEPADGQAPQQRLRVLIASRNLTFDTSWDTVLRLDETADATGAVLEPVGELFQVLLTAAVGAVSPAHQQRVHSLSAALRTAAFALPTGVKDLRIHVLGITQQPSPLPGTAERSLIISPFVSDGFFQRVHPAPVDELVSRAESLDLLVPGALANVATAYTFDDGSAADLLAEEGRSSPQDPGRPLVGLHAKVFAFEDKGRARLFVGSANATWAAFNSNVEILVELVGPTAVLGIDRLCGGTEDERGLRDLFNTYGGPEPVDNPSEAASLVSARRAIARLPIEGFVTESGTEWAVTYRSAEPVPVVDGTEIHCWPLASAGNRRRVAMGKPFEVRFETSLEAISGFLAFELAHEDSTLTGFVMPVPLVDVPEHRERFLLRALVGNAERFLRYLLALLDEDSGQMDLLEAVERVGADASGDGHGAASLPVLEKLLRTMRRDPAKLAGLHPLVSDLAEDGALPPGFAELWAAIYDVAIAGAAAR
ncbi:phospholipase D family protein [Candidatus Poriferisodalis sp.]|uniref:phospholipase D family protein n=1 Tax=Candidatus Poriferisodalis sp. TaxID=3101277 RepID=UPI003C702CA9